MKTGRLLIICLIRENIFFDWRLAKVIILLALLRMTLIYLKYIHTIHFAQVHARQMYHIRTRQFSFMSNQWNILNDGVQVKDGINGWSGCY